MKVFLSNHNYYKSPLVTETEDRTILELYKAIFSSSDQIKEIHNVRKKVKDNKFFQKLLFLLTGIQFDEELSEALWNEIEKYHKDMVSSIGRNIHISATVVDYMFRVKNYLRNPSVVDLVLTEKIKNSVLQDFITGLYRGSYFEDFVKRELNRSQRHNHFFSIILFQVNGLESISLSGNTNIAIKILVDVSTIVKNSKRAEDIAFKFSVSKFGIILPETNKKGALLFARRLLSEISSSVMSTSGLIFGLFLSMGIQTYPEDGKDVQSIISNVEKALYKSKISGHNRIIYEI
ncbi:MAG: GGDEF domain-containing protein [Brevinematales bacterium]|nr:GGDEF domain-containing protein [Brevinematales bacterium]